jgi:hypothetical protein
MPASDQTLLPVSELTPHALSTTLITAALQVVPAQGLTAADVKARQIQYGPNVLQTIRRVLRGASS